MAISLLHSVGTATSAASVTSLTATITSTTVGTTLLAGVAHTSVSTTLSAPANWVQVGTTLVATRSTAIFLYKGNPGGITSVQFSSTASGGMSVVVAEFAGCPMNFALDVAVATNNSASSTTMDSGTTGTTNYASELWFAILVYGASTVKTISSVTNSFSTDIVTTADGSSSGGTWVRLSDYYKVTGATGTANVGATLSAASNWQGMICTLSPISAANGGGAGGQTATAELDALPSGGGSGGTGVAAQTTATSSGGGSGGPPSTASLSGTAMSGGRSGGPLATAQTTGASLLGGGGGTVPLVQLSAVTAGGGSGGPMQQGLLSSLVAVGGSGGDSSAALLSAFSLLGGGGGLSSTSVLSAIVLVGGTGGLGTLPIVIPPRAVGGIIVAATSALPTLSTTSSNPTFTTIGVA